MTDASPILYAVEAASSLCLPTKRCAARAHQILAYAETQVHSRFQYTIVLSPVECFSADASCLST